jgi:hypothetical protein
MSKKVTFVQVHDVIHVPGVGQFDKALSTTKTLQDKQMTLEDNGSILVTWTEGPYTKRLLIGAAMVKAALLEPELKAPVKESKK